MEYSVIIEGTSYDLPSYDFKIADSIEAIKSSVKLREKCKKMYEFIKLTLGKDITEQIIGKFENSCDPNKIQIIYMSIVDQYSKPITEYNMRDIQDKMEESHLAEMAKLIDSLTHANEIVR